MHSGLDNIKSKAVYCACSLMLLRLLFCVFFIYKLFILFPINLNLNVLILGTMCKDFSGHNAPHIFSFFR